MAQEGSTYEFRLLDDGGRVICYLKDYYFFSYSRSVNGFGTCEMGFQYDVFKEQVFPFFQPDRRIDVWRSPQTGMPMRREGTYLLRMYRVYDRTTDGVQIIVLHCRDLKDLLNRRYIIQAAGTTYTRKTAAIDDMMKEIVREQMLYGNAVDANGALDPTREFPVGEFLVQGDLTLGPVITQTFQDRNVLDTLKELREASFQLANSVTGNQKIYFDVVSYGATGQPEEILQEAAPNPAILDEAGNPLLDESSIIGSSSTMILRFETYAGLRGVDRTAGLVFSPDNNNLEAPYYSKSHLEEANSVIVKGFGRGDSREWAVVDSDGATSSRWNRIEAFKDASSEPDQTNLADYAYETLFKNEAKEEMTCVFLNTPGSEDTPRSLYSVDWNVGDLLPVEYAGQRWSVEVDIVWVAKDENGKENISGHSAINAMNQA
jgi:hypothetical protein